MDSSLLWFIVGTFAGGLIIAIFVSAYYSKRIDGIKEDQKVLCVVDEFEKIWDMSDQKAHEAWLWQQKEEMPKDFSAEEDKKFIDEKREKYINDMMTMYQLKYEE